MMICNEYELMQSELNPKWEIGKNTLSQNTKRTYGKPNEQLYPKRSPALSSSVIVSATLFHCGTP